MSPHVLPPGVSSFSPSPSSPLDSGRTFNLCHLVDQVLRLSFHSGKALGMVSQVRMLHTARGAFGNIKLPQIGHIDQRE